MQKNGNGQRAAEQFIAPVATVTEKGDGYTLQIEMPGVKKDGLEIWVENNELTITGRRSLPAVSGTIVHREFRRENFRRAFELDPSSTSEGSPQISSMASSHSLFQKRSR